MMETGYAIVFIKTERILRMMKMDKGVFNMFCIFRYKKDAECFLLYLNEKMRKELRIAKIII